MVYPLLQVCQVLGLGISMEMQKQTTEVLLVWLMMLAAQLAIVVCWNSSHTGQQMEPLSPGKQLTKRLVESNWILFC